MKSIYKTNLTAIAILALCASNAYATASAADLARLGKDLTPMGAEMAGSKDGTIPAWTGGVTKAPAGFDMNKGWADPFAGEKPLFTITQANVAQYKDKLNAGQLALLKKYPEYKINVYPTHRTAAYPQTVYDYVKSEAGKADTANNGNSIVNVTHSTTPFPIPKSGVEVIWNHLFRYRGNAVVRNLTNFPVQLNGDFTAIHNTESMIFASTLKSPPENLLFYWKQQTTAPSSMAGSQIMVHESVDQVKQPRKAWVYNPGSRRVLRAPEISYDGPTDGVDGLRVTDDYDGYNGSPDRFEWKLIGKKEMYIPYNNYKITDKSLKYKDIIKPNVLNPDMVRYELHRVWEVEGTLRKGANHVYGKRVYQIDEDSWQIAEGQLYDGRGELWRVKELYGVEYYTVPCFWLAGDVQYDLQSRKYLVSGLSSEEKPYVFDAPLAEGDFTTGAMKR